MAEEGKPNVLGNSLFLKILLLVAVGIIVFVLLTGVKLDLGSIVWTSLQLVFAGLIIFLVFKGIQALLKPKPYSPTEDFKKKITRIGELCKPFNVKRLYLRGEDMRVYSLFGAISGLIFIPYTAGKPEQDDNGNIIYIDKKDLSGKNVLDPKTNKPFKVPKMQLLTEKDGDWCFIIKKGWFIFAETFLVRSHYSMTSEIGENVWIKDVNIVLVGDYLYPAKMWQTDILRILEQHKSEAIIQTHENFLDLISNTTQMALGGDPTYQKILMAQSEALSNNSGGFLVRGGNQQ